jgi:hypothetical protein
VAPRRLKFLYMARPVFWFSDHKCEYPMDAQVPWIQSAPCQTGERYESVGCAAVSAISGAPPARTSSRGASSHVAGPPKLFLI